MYLHNHLITLRAPEPEDIDTIYRWENDSSLWEYGETIEPYSRYTLRKYLISADKTIYEKQQLRLMVQMNETKQIIGAVDLFGFEAYHLRAGIGVLIDSAYRRQGFSVMALALLVDYAFHFLHLNQLYCHIHPANTASIRMVMHAGFKQVGTLRQWLRRDNGYEDVGVFQLLASEANTVTNSL
jgi:diamine N-acetyltransferase